MFDKKRTRKKKRLTDPVAIIAFAGQNAREKVQVKKEVAPAAAPMQLYKEAKILSSPTGQLNNQNLSIKDLLKQQQEKKDASEHEGMGEKPTEPFTYDDLKMHWRQFAHKQKNAGLETLYAALTMNEPALNGEKVVHTVDSLVHLEFIKSHEQDLVQHLRAVLKNYNLQIEFLEGTGEGGVKKPVTGNDKFEEMAKRNPNLKAFKKLFKLDIDF